MFWKCSELVHSQSFLSLHVYLLPEIPLYLCLFTHRAFYLSMSIYSRRSLSIYVYLLPELPISPCLSTPWDPSLSIYAYLLPELYISPCLSTPGDPSLSILSPSFSIYIFSQSFFSIHIYLLCAQYFCYLPLLMCPALSTRCYWENMPWCCWQLGNLTTSYNTYRCIMFYYFPRPG